MKINHPSWYAFISNSKHPPDTQVSMIYLEAVSHQQAMMYLGNAVAIGARKAIYSSREGVSSGQVVEV